MKFGQGHVRVAQRLLQTQTSVAGTRGGYGRSICTQCRGPSPIVREQNATPLRALRLEPSPTDGKALLALPARSVAGQRRAFATVKHGM